MKNTLVNRLVIAACLLPLLACTTQFNATRVMPGTVIPVAGAPYNLTFTKFKLGVTRRVHCFMEPSQEELADKSKPRTYIPLVTVKVEASATSTEARDPERNYVIDLKSLDSFFRSTDVKVTYYDNGAIKSVNAEAEDKSGEFAGNVAQTFGKLVVAGVARHRDPATSALRCKDDVAKADKELEGKQQTLDALTEQMVVVTDQINRYTVLAAALGRNMSQTDRDELSKNVALLIRHQAEQERQRNDIKHDLKLITVSDEFSWPKDGETFMPVAPALKQLDDDTLTRWFGTADVPIASQTAIYLKLASGESIGRDTSCGTNCVETEHPGLKYRMPVLGSLSMCDGGAIQTKTPVATEAYHCDKWKTVTKPELISQLGRIYTLPLKSTMFNKKTLSASFSEKGVPTLLGVGSSASSDKVASALNGISDAAVSVHNSRAGREVADLESKIKLLKLQKEYQIASSAPEPAGDHTKQDAAAVFSVDTALLKAELANIEARKALADVKNMQ